MQAQHQDHTHPTPAGVYSETSNDLRAAFRVATHTLRLWELQGKLPPAIKVGRRKLWPAGTIERLMAEATRQAAVAASCEQQEGGAA